MLPISTIVGLQVGLLLSGAILTETVFAFPGIGTWLQAAIENRDYPVHPGRRPVRRDHRRARQPARRHLVRAAQPAHQTGGSLAMSIAEMEVTRARARATRRRALARRAASHRAQSRRDRRLRPGRLARCSSRSSRRCSPPTTRSSRISTRSRRAAVPARRASTCSGQDDLGRDELSRLIYGARYSLLIGVVAVTVGLSAGLLLGSIAGYFRRTDGLIMRVHGRHARDPGLPDGDRDRRAVRGGRAPPGDDRDRGRQHPDLHAPDARLDPRPARQRLRPGSPRGGRPVEEGARLAHPSRTRSRR